MKNLQLWLGNRVVKKEKKIKGKQTVFIHVQGWMGEFGHLNRLWN